MCLSVFRRKRKCSKRSFEDKCSLLGSYYPNASVEIGLSRKFTTDWQLAYNPWTFRDDRKMRFWLVQPELRYWFCESFEGHFVGAHLHGAQYYGGFSDKRYDGYLVGG